MRLRNLCLSATLGVLMALALFAQNVPRLVSFGGVIKDAAGKPVNGTVPVTFSLFAEQEGGTALWTETQMVDADAQGKYTAFLGATNPNGLPLEVFTSGAARWLAVEPGAPAAVESSRVLLVGVPYALKAADADTLGGKPASAYLTAGAPSEQPRIETAITPTAAPGPPPPTTPSGSGTTDYVPLWTSSTNLGDSILFQTDGLMQVLGPLQLVGTGTATPSTAYDSEPIDLFASAYSSSSHAAVPQHFRWQAEPVSNNTSAPSGKLDLLFASGGGLTGETGLSVSSTGVLTFAPGQTFPGTGSGTIKGVTAGTDLTGGGTSGVVTLNVDTTKVPQLKTANTFTGNQSVTGSITATGALTTSAGVYSDYGSFQGDGVFASAPTFGIYAFETADSDGNIAVFGGAQGATYSTIGVWGQTASPTGVGVYGELVGPSSAAHQTTRTAGVWGDTNVAGAFGVLGTSDNGYAGYFESNGGQTLYAYNDATEASPFFAGSPGGSCEIDSSGSIDCTGSKNAVVPVDGGTRKVALSAVEAPENWFEDFGSGQLSEGVAHIQLEPVFAQTVNTGMEYHVFLTPKGDSKGLYVTNETAMGFEVHESAGGRSSIAFDYRIVARRKGYETIRLADKTKDFDPSRMPRRNAKGSSKPPVAPLAGAK